MTVMTTPPSSGGTPGYLRTLKTLSVQAIQQAFQVTYPIADAAGGAQSVYCSLEYPVRETAYPGVWVTYAPAQLQTAGIDYTETDANNNTYVRWRFSGTISFTVAALSNNERDLYYDQLVSVLAYASQSNVPSPFRVFIETSQLMEVTFSYDTLDSAGHGESVGTPWGTDEVIYEDGVSIQVTGEFTVDPLTGSLQPVYNLSKIQVTAYDQDPVTGAAEHVPAWMTVINQNALNAAIPGPEGI